MVVLDKNKYFTEEQTIKLLSLICDKQIHMMINDNSYYLDDDYKIYEKLKIKINALKVPKRTCKNCACNECASNKDTYTPCNNCKICSKTDNLERWNDKDAECFCKE